MREISYLIVSHSRRPSGTTGGRLAMPGYRGTFVGEMTKQQYDIIDAAEKVAAELGTDAVTGFSETSICISHLWFTLWFFGFARV